MADGVPLPKFKSEAEAMWEVAEDLGPGVMAALDLGPEVRAALQAEYDRRERHPGRLRGSRPDSPGPEMARLRWHERPERRARG